MFLSEIFLGELLSGRNHFWSLWYKWLEFSLVGGQSSPVTRADVLKEEQVANFSNSCLTEFGAVHKVEAATCEEIVESSGREPNTVNV